MSLTQFGQILYPRQSTVPKLTAKDITTPTLIVDKEKCIANIQRMAAKAKATGVRLRPHCKTHACVEIAKWMKEHEKLDQITVSSLSMAVYFDEWGDILVAFPVNVLEMEKINNLAFEVTDLQLLVENVEAVESLETNLEHSIKVWIKIDCGYHRTGIPADDFVRVEEVLNKVKASERLRFQGFLTHSGHTYSCRSKDEILAIHRVTKQLLMTLKERYIKDFPNLQLSIGDTPSCSVLDAEEFKGFDEIRPGNFVFYDVEQSLIGSCTTDQIAVAVACPIVAKHIQRRELIVYGGGVHFSKDRIVDENGITIYGKVVRRESDDSLKWGGVIPGMYVKGLSQEHGKVVVPETEDWEDYEIGDLLFVLPVHSCMTADALKHKGYLTTDGEVLPRMTN